MKEKILFLFIVLMSCAGVVGAETLDRIVAVVNGDIILYSDLRERYSALEKTNSELQTTDMAKRSQMEREVLEQLVREKLTEQEAKRLKISTSDQELDESIATIKRENHLTDEQFAEVLKNGGQTTEQFRGGLRKEMERNRLIDRVLKSKTVITEGQIDAFLASGGQLEPSKGTTSAVPENRRLGIIFMPVAKGKKPDEVEKLANDVYGRLKGGADFASLAREYSKGPAAEEGGDIGFVAPDELNPAIATAIQGLKKGETSGVVKVPEGFYLVKVLDIGREEKAAVSSSTDSGAREKARKFLFQKEMNRKFDEWVQELRSRSFVQISL